MPFKDIERKKEYQRRKYHENLDKERLRGRVKHQKNKKMNNKRSEEYRKNNLDKFARKAQTYRINYPEKVIAHQLAQSIKLEDSCGICKSNLHLERHHWRYDKPLLVPTLCNECHSIQHMKKR